MATIIANSAPFWGMVIYEVTGDGTLQGTWKNNGLSNDSILGETARKINNIPEIPGTYTVTWIEENDSAHTGTLTVADIQNQTAFSFVWMEGANIVFQGIGMQIGLSQIAVTYWDTRRSLTLRI